MFLYSILYNTLFEERKKGKGVLSEILLGKTSQSV